jgi:hypothetical protein
MIESAKAGSYEVKVVYDWKLQTIKARDFTLRTYYPESIQIKDRHGRTNQVSMEYVRKEEEKKEPK